MTQYYEAEVVSEYVIRGNAAIVKCTIPSFVAEFVSVDSWVGSDGSIFRPTNDYGTTFIVLVLFSVSFVVVLLLLLSESSGLGPSSFFLFLGRSVSRQTW